MEDLKEKVLEYIEDKNKCDYFYKGILWETFCEYEFRYNNYEDYEEDLPKELLDFEDIKSVADYICDNEYMNIELHNIMCDRFRNYKEV